MQRTRVTAKLRGEARTRDFDLPADMRAADVAEALARRLGVDSGGQYDIVAIPPGRPLRPDETLAEAGAWDGAWIELVPRGPTQPAATPAPPPSPAPHAAPPDGGYIFKRIDRD